MATNKATPSQRLYKLRAELKKDKKKREKLKEQIRNLKSKDGSIIKIRQLTRQLEKKRKDIQKLNSKINEVWQDFPFSKEKVARLKKRIKAFDKGTKKEWPERPEWRKQEEKFVKDVSKQVDGYLVASRKAFKGVSTKAQLEKAVTKLGGKILTFDQQIFKKVKKYQETLDLNHKQYFEKAVKETLGKNVGKIVAKEGAPTKRLVDRRITENFNLIKSIPEDHLKRTEKLFRDALDDKLNQKQLVKIIQEQEKLPKWRAELIARDQTAKAMSDIEKARQENLGISRYIWRTAMDDRVRPTHEEKEGETFSWDNPPDDTGHPGQDINCRCVAEPILDDLFD